MTINNYLRNMSAFFNWCVEEGLILRSPVKRRDYIKVERRPLEFVSDEDFRKLLRNMNTASFSEYRDYIIIQLLLDTGMRINECLMIQVTDVNLPKRYIYLPAENTKGKKESSCVFLGQDGNTTPTVDKI
ncbi:MAG: tyrosine-type recombinase/integrase [Faecalibacterium prausnitzii]